MQKLRTHPGSRVRTSGAIHRRERGRIEQRLLVHLAACALRDLLEHRKRARNLCRFQHRGAGRTQRGRLECSIGCA